MSFIQFFIKKSFLMVYYDSGPRHQDTLAAEAVQADRWQRDCCEEMRRPSNLRNTFGELKRKRRPCTWMYEREHRYRNENKVPESSGAMETKRRRSVWEGRGESTGQNVTDRLNGMSSTVDLMTRSWALTVWLAQLERCTLWAHCRHLRHRMRSRRKTSVFYCFKMR